MPDAGCRRPVLLQYSNRPVTRLRDRFLVHDELYIVHRPHDYDGVRPPMPLRELWSMNKQWCVCCPVPVCTHRDCGQSRGAFSQSQHITSPLAL